jgi:hypothetical protein
MEEEDGQEGWRRIDDILEPATEEDDSLLEDNRNNETFDNSVDLDYAWEEEHQLVASQLEEEKRRQRQSLSVDDKLRMLSLRQEGGEHNYTTREEYASVGSKERQQFYSDDIWGNRSLPLAREQPQPPLTPALWLEQSRPKKVVFAEELERSLLEKSSHPSSAVDHGSTWLEKGWTEAPVKGKTREQRDNKPEYPNMERESYLSKKKNVWKAPSESRRWLDTEYPSLESTRKLQDSHRKKAASFVQNYSVNNNYNSKSVSTEQRQKRTSYRHNRGGNAGHQFIRKLSSKWMTSSEIELIAKMHIRQLETSSWPIEDFYCQAYQRKLQKTREEQVINEHPNSRDKRRTWKSGYFPHHSENNLKILERALGSIQGYNPNAPRRIVQIASDSSSDTFKEEVSLTDTIPFHEDSRIAAQSVISSAFDMLFELEDALSDSHSCSNAELERVKEKLSRRLLSIFGISVEEDLGDETRNVFSRVCALPKGRKLLIRCFAVLPQTYIVPLVNMILFSLGMILKRMTKASLKDSSWQQFTDSVIHCMEDVQDISVIMEWTHSFVVGHSRDEKLFLHVVTSASSLSIVSSLLFHAFRGVDDNSHPPLKSLLNILCERLILSVEEMFQSVEHAVVWQLIALLDGFVETKLREKLRMIIKKLIEEQRVTLHV